MPLPYIPALVPIPRDSRDNWLAEKPVTQMVQVPGKGATPTSVMFTSPAPKPSPSIGVSDVMTQWKNPMSQLLTAYGQYSHATDIGKQQGAARAATYDYKPPQIVTESSISPLTMVGIVVGVGLIGLVGVLMMKGK